MLLNRYLTIAMVVFGLSFPMTMPCGAPGRFCRTDPDYQGRSQEAYDLQPFFVSLIEFTTGRDFPLRYSQGNRSLGAP
jgi:hypothetical protein